MPIELVAAVRKMRSTVPVEWRFRSEGLAWVNKSDDGKHGDGWWAGRPYIQLPVVRILNHSQPWYKVPSTHGTKKATLKRNLKISG